MRIPHALIFGFSGLPYALLTAQPAWRAHGGELAELADVGTGDHVLDLGCGPGESAFGMLDRVAGLRVTGLDLQPGMIRLARLRARLQREPNRATFVCGDAMQLPFEDESFDAVTGHSFLYLVPDVHRVLSEVRRVLRVGRRCAFLEPSGEPSSSWRAAVGLRGLRTPRFATSMALWRLVSRGYRRFDRADLGRVLGDGGLEPVEVKETLGGLGLYAVASKR